MSRSVGEFNLVGHLGEGSFATVFLAIHRDTGREFAMKAISRNRMQGKLQENLESEISILKTYRHGNIVELYDIKKTERHIYLVLEYLAGGDLRALIRKEGRLPEPAVRHFMRHLGSGLHFLWSKNLVHRDLKPQNLLLTGLGLDATLKIADFGFARELGQASMAETICGSPLYMAPEILQGQKYDAKADLWSVGAILFEMLAGKPPFGGANQVQLLANIHKAPTPPAREGYYPMPDGVPRVGRACAELLCCLLVPEPQHRASFREFFSSDVLRLFSSSEGGGRGGGSVGDPWGGSETRHKIATGGNSPAMAAAPVVVATAGGAGERRGGAENKARDMDPSGHGHSSGYDAQAHALEVASGARQRGSVAPTPLEHGGEGRGAPQGKGQGQGQGHDRGSWWPLAGWRWGGGGGAGTDTRGRNVDDPRFTRFTRTNSEPTSATQQRNRVKTLPNSLPRCLGVADHLHYQAGTSGGGALSKGRWAQPQLQQGLTSRPPLTPPSPSRVSISQQRRSRGGGPGAIPIPIGQGASRRGSRGAYGHDRDPQQGQAPWSPSDTGGGAHYWSPHLGRGHAALRGDGVDGDGGGDIAPLQYYERRRVRPHGPSSAPEVSYLGYAAARAREWEQESAAYYDAAAADRVACSVAEDAGRGGDGLRGRYLSYGLGAEVSREASRDRRRDEAGAPWPAPDEPPHHRDRRSRPPFDLGGGGGGRPLSVESSPRASPRISPRDSPHLRGYSASNNQRTMTKPAVPVSVPAQGKSFQALTSSPPESYPLQLAAMIGAQRQRMWDVGSGVPTGGGSGGGLPHGGGLVEAAEIAGGIVAAVGGFEQQQQEQQQQQQQQRQYHVKGRTDSGDGSGGSDDFVMVDDSVTPSSPDQMGGQPTAATGRAQQQQQHFSRLGAGVRGRMGVAAGAEVNDPRSLGPRLLAGRGRWVWGGMGGGWQAPAAGGGGGAMGVGDGPGAGIGGGGPSPLSLEGIVRCLQIVELFGRRAVLLAQLGDSCVVPAMHVRQKESADAHMRSSRVAAAAVAAGSRRGQDGGNQITGSLRQLQLAAERRPFVHTTDGHGGAFSQGETKPPLFADQEDTTWFPSLLRTTSGASGDLAFGAGGSGDGGGGSGGGGATFGSVHYGDNGSLASNTASAGDRAGAGEGSTCCDSHRLFGEALVLYLKSLSMAKEAIVWGNQALGPLSHAHPASAAAAATAAAPSAPPPPSSPNLQAAAHLHMRGSPGPASVATLSPDSVTGVVVATENSPHHTISRPGSGRLARGGGSSTVSPGSTGGGVPTSGGGVSIAASNSAGLAASLSMTATSSEAQVAAWGGSLLGWLTGQFSTILRRAERCREELRGTNEAGLASAPERGSAAATAAASEMDRDGGDSGAGITDSAPAEGGRGRKFKTPSSSTEVSLSTTRGGRSAIAEVKLTPAAAAGTGDAAALAPLAVGEGFMLSSSSKHGAAPGAVAVSAKDIVVRAALAQAQESAASEVLGMWEPARKGYEKAAVLLETLLLDALVVRPEGSAGLGRSSAIGGSGATVSPRRGWMASATGELGTVSGSAGGVLSEADQRTLQNYMTKFSRRAAEVSAMEKEEAKAASVAVASSAAITPAPTIATGTKPTADASTGGNQTVAAMPLQAVDAEKMSVVTVDAVEQRADTTDSVP